MSSNVRLCVGVLLMILLPPVSTLTYSLFPDTPLFRPTDYIRAYPEQVRAFVPMRYTVLGTAGFGRSDTRQNLRRFFEVDRYHIAQAAIAALAAEGRRSEEHTSELQSLMRTSYAVFCLKKKTHSNTILNQQDIKHH